MGAAAQRIRAASYLGASLMGLGLVAWPTLQCGASIMPGSPFLQVMLLASQYALPTDTMYAAHLQQNALCDEAAALSAPLPAGELLVIMPPAGETHIPQVSGYPQSCRRRATLTLCAGSPTLLSQL